MKTKDSASWIQMFQFEMEKGSGARVHVVAWQFEYTNATACN